MDLPRYNSNLFLCVHLMDHDVEVDCPKNKIYTFDVVVDERECCHTTDLTKMCWSEPPRHASN